MEKIRFDDEIGAGKERRKRGDGRGNRKLLESHAFII